MTMILFWGKLENNLERNCDPTNIAVERAFGIDSFLR